MMQLPDDVADDVIDALYAEWLIAQPEAMITSGDALIIKMERKWGWGDFVAQLAEQLRATITPSP